MNRHLFLTFAFALLIPASATAQHSIIDQIIKAQPALVMVRSDVTAGIAQNPQAAAAIDPQTGRMIIQRSLAVATYSRSGAGVIIDPSGVICTNAHNVKGADRIEIVLSDGRKFGAAVITVVDNLDFALLKIRARKPLPVILIADSDQVSLRDEIITVGNSPLLKDAVSGGRVTGLGTSRSSGANGKQHTALIQTSINLYKGDSGGPLFDRQGRLIGLMTAKETGADRSSFAIPSNKIKEYLAVYLQQTRG